jgi:predicted subunit of tRNA(5-methylaminomethyl-2-thiouridylate) methyltransferase
MQLGLCFSGGKDSSLAAFLLDGFYDVTLVTAHFGLTEDWEWARETAESLGFRFQRVEMDRQVAEAAVDRMLEDGYPRNGIQQVHEHALETVATMDRSMNGDTPESAHDGFDAVADGTRRDDRVPTISRATAQSLEDRHEVDYVAPLTGFGRSAVDRLVDATLEVEVGPSEDIQRSDYEAELRALLADREGPEAVDDIFPDHEQTAVVSRR